MSNCYRNSLDSFRMLMNKEILNYDNEIPAKKKKKMMNTNLKQYTVSLHKQIFHNVSDIFLSAYMNLFTSTSLMSLMAYNICIWNDYFSHKNTNPRMSLTISLFFFKHINEKAENTYKRTDAENYVSTNSHSVLKQPVQSVVSVHRLLWCHQSLLYIYLYSCSAAVT